MDSLYFKEHQLENLTNSVHPWCGYLIRKLSAETRFQDHKFYHHATHANCEVCCQLLETLPFFTFEMQIKRGSSLYLEGIYEENKNV